MAGAVSAFFMEVDCPSEVAGGLPCRIEIDKRFTEEADLFAVRGGFPDIEEDRSRERFARRV